MLNFTNWVQWQNRATLGKMLNHQGIYMLAHFDEGPPKAVSMTQEIIYVGVAGKTAGSVQAIANRLNAFDRAASGKTARHSGGKSYFRQFKGIQSNLYVAVNPVNRANQVEKACYILKMERILIWRYVHRFRHGLPICNSE
jgi:hypothetical protein